MTETSRLKHLCDRWGEYGLGISAEEYTSDGVRLIRTSDITDDGELLDEGVFVDPALADSLPSLRTGDLLVSRSGTVGRSLLFNQREHGTCTFAAYLVRFRLKRGLDPRFIYYFTKSAPFEQQIQLDSTQATIANFNAQKLGNLQVPSFKPGQQRVIAGFLDRETARIDRLIERKRRLQEWLRQRRMEMARVATTRGLRPSGLRETGVDWLGPIPRAWMLWRLGYAFKTGSGTTPESQNLDYYGGEIPWLTTSELRDLPIASTNRSVTDAALRDYPALKTFPRGALVIAMYGATIGRLGLLEIETTTNQACCILYESEVLLTKFVFYWLWAHRRHILALGSGGGQGNISQDIIRNLRVPTPPRQEQEQIVEFLDAEGSQWRELETRLVRQIELLTEHRQTLITAAVTGQLDVPGAA